MVPAEIHTPHFVSTKVALYSHDKSQVLVMWYSHAYGLPGGHLEANETPDQAIAREFMEELGAVLPPVKHADFFLRSGETGDVILGFVGIAPSNLELKPPVPTFEHGIWSTRDEIDGYNLSVSYKKFVLENWPT